MVVVGLTGGIGSGKSSVSRRLAERGAVVIDADAIVRELQQPGQPVLAAIVERFGPAMLTDDGHLDRPALAALVFHDDEARDDLNRIVHPAVAAETARRIEAAGPHAVVVLDIPLLVETNRQGLAGVVVVDCPEEVALARLVEHRGMAAADVRARMAAQATREERLARADVVIRNDGDLAHLDAEVDRAWAWLVARRDAPAG